MTKSSSQLISSAKRAILNMLTRCIERDVQPSFFDMYYAGYAEGITDKEQGLTLDTSWHYITLEGNPPTDDECYCLIQADGYQETSLGHYDKDEDKWYCEHWYPLYEKVIAWHPLPTIEKK